MILFNNLDIERNGCFHSSSRDSSLVAISFYFFTCDTCCKKRETGSNYLLYPCCACTHIS